MDNSQPSLVGSTRFVNERAPSAIRGFLRDLIADQRPHTVISGGAAGVDDWAAAAAQRAGYHETAGTLIVHRPANRRWKPDGFQARNLKIIGDATHLIAIRCAVSKFYGSGWTADRAEEAGKPVIRLLVAPNGPVDMPVRLVWPRPASGIQQQLEV